MIAATLAFVKADPWRAGAMVLGFALLGQTMRLLDERGDTAKARTALAELRTNHAEERQRAAAVALHSFTRMQEAKDDALRQAEFRNARLALDAGAARTAADSLRRDLSAVPARIAAASHEAVAEYATAVSVVFDQCVREYQGMAQLAAGHASDVRTLSEAWPTNDPGAIESSPSLTP